MRTGRWVGGSRAAGGTHLVGTVLQAAQQCQQVGLGKEVPAATLPGMGQERGHRPCRDEDEGSEIGQRNSPRAQGWSGWGVPTHVGAVLSSSQGSRCLYRSPEWPSAGAEPSSSSGSWPRG